jgi:hypothetical protein
MKATKIRQKTILIGLQMERMRSIVISRLQITRDVLTTISSLHTPMVPMSEESMLPTWQHTPQEIDLSFQHKISLIQH